MSPIAAIRFIFVSSRMYQNCSVLNAESEKLKIPRAALVDATGQVIGHALGLLGIKTVERM